ncbi:uncharacterized protein FMAN_11990 [Fusarium mangiferae]|uniref:Uncharacterized protein n=1 Tax=Fusarium mangiferae TaxID=192010 RepID=A0A1L7UGN9_FUSMA|nr:uncharacterized protein FMAN_11990 [Fusarium mangiferae]CVL06897.1 uncharacterized protein FMAN_11990 [Fusarium mangiferae]
MSLKRRGSELDHEAKKMKSDDSHGDDEVSPSSGVQTTPTLPHQPVAVFADLSQTAREQVNYLLQALSDISPKTLYEVNILDQINAVNSDGHHSPPRLTYKPPDMRITIGYDTHGTSPAVLVSELTMLINIPGDVNHDSKQKNWHKLVAHVTTKRYAAGYCRVGTPHKDSWALYSPSHIIRMMWE